MYNSATQRYSEMDLLSLEGRMGKKHYFFYTTAIPFILFWVFMNLAEVASKLGGNSIAAALLGLTLTASILFLVRLTIQRCHDFNVTGWFAILAVIPFASLLFSLIPGNNGLNSYGEPTEPASKIINTSVNALILLLIIISTYLFLTYFNIKLSSFI